MSNNDGKPINLPQLKQLIHSGLEAIPIDKDNQEAIIVIGDTGVGKSTIMSFLAGAQLVVKYDGLKPYLDNSNSSKIKIGHEKYSETSIPTKVVIDGMAFYDCPGFKDNKGEEYEISNSFFVQRLLDIYSKVKLVLIVDESHVSEARADKLPKLIKNLHRSFKTFEDIKDGVCIIINRAAPDHSVEDYNKEIRKMTKLKNELGPLFMEKEQEFLDFLMFRKRVLLFKQAGKGNATSFQPGSDERGILDCIRQMSYVKSKHIENILSESAKLAIRDFIDEITQRSNNKIEIICAEIIEIYTVKVQNLGRDVGGIIKLKEDVTRLAEEVMASKKENIVNILQRELDHSKIQDFEEDFASIMFFKGIYDKTGVYFSNLTNKIYAELSHLLTKLDKRITVIQREAEDEKQKQIEIEQTRQREVQREKEKVIAMEHCDKMEDLKAVAQNLVAGKKNLIEEIKAAMRALGTVEDELRKVKVDAVNLKKLSKEIDHEFERIDSTYFQRRVR
jgi:energy-coupling factor transporter ATP-binding protein EcfA2